MCVYKYINKTYMHRKKKQGRTHNQLLTAVTFENNIRGQTLSSFRCFCFKLQRTSGKTQYHSWVYLPKVKLSQDCQECSPALSQSGGAMRLHGSGRYFWCSLLHQFFSSHPSATNYKPQKTAPLLSCPSSHHSLSLLIFFTSLLRVFSSVHSSAPFILTTSLLHVASDPMSLPSWMLLLCPPLSRLLNRISQS